MLDGGYTRAPVRYKDFFLFLELFRARHTWHTWLAWRMALGLGTVHLSLGLGLGLAWVW